MDGDLEMVVMMMSLSEKKQEEVQEREGERERFGSSDTYRKTVPLPHGAMIM